MASGSPAKPHGLNTEGLKRRGFSESALQALKQAYKTLYRSNLTLEQALTQLRLQATLDEVALLVSFLEQQTRGIIR